MKELIHAQNVLQHLEIFIEVAEGLSLGPQAARLEKHRADLQVALDRADIWDKKKNEAKSLLKSAEVKASAFYQQSTFEMAYFLDEEQYIALCAGRNLNVINRIRYWQRALSRMRQPSESVRLFVENCQGILGRYDEAVDHFLEAMGWCKEVQRAALRQSQVIRQFLEEAKAQILVACPVGSEEYKTIKKQVVRTKKALWVPASPPVERSGRHLMSL